MILLPHEFWEIKETSEKGRGVFAKKEISKGTVIGDYIGTVLKPWEVEVDEDNFYLMYYHDRAVISPDETTIGAHLLNHSCNPNSWLYIYKGHTLAFALRSILTGEEITISYLLAPNISCSPCKHICLCGEDTCTGTMHLPLITYDTWKRINTKQAKETKKQRIQYGKELPLLSSYPQEIPGEYIETIRALF